MLGLISDRSFAHVKGTIEKLAATIAPESNLQATAYEAPLLAAGHGAELTLGGKLLGYLGDTSREGNIRQTKWRQPKGGIPNDRIWQYASAPPTA